MEIENIDVDCPKCDTSLSVSVRDIAEQRTVVCRNGHDIDLVDNGGGASRAQKSLDALDKQLGELGRTINFKL